MASENVMIEVSPSEFKIVLAALVWFRTIAKVTDQNRTVPNVEKEIGPRLAEMANAPLLEDHRRAMVMAEKLISELAQTKKPPTPAAQLGDEPERG